jgi:radical SAM superfamily enzyme YgiQ (UPF0313 family)
MVFRGRLDNRPTLLSVKDTSVSLAVGNEWIAAWDLGGRLYSLWKHGHTYRRGLNGRVLHKWRDEGSSERNPYDARRRVHVEGEEADALVQETADVLRGLNAALARDPSGWADADGGNPAASVMAVFERCSRFDAATAREDATRFTQVFSPVGILPPDQYLSIVLQATEGCSFGTCTFCDLYHDRYRVKSAGEFSRHVETVREYLGASVHLRGRSVFLGAANALAVPMPRIVEFFDAIASVFDAPRRPIHAFVDGFTGLRKTAREYADLRLRGLRRVYVGLESGHDPLLAFVRKPATCDQAVEAVRTIKAGGVSVGVIVMVGLGGRRFAAGHVTDTTAAVNDLRLGPDDLLFFSDLVEVPGTDYPQRAVADEVQPLSLDERLDQLAAIRAGLVFEGPPPHFARYDIREFVY